MTKLKGNRRDSDDMTWTGYTSTDLKLRITNPATHKLRLYTQNEFSIISVLLIVIGISFWSVLKTPVLECGGVWHGSSRVLRCRAKTVTFFGVVDAESTRFAEPNDIEVEVKPVESVSFIPATLAQSSPFDPFNVDSINYLRIGGSNPLAAIDIPLSPDWRDADQLATYLQAAIANPESSPIVVSSPLNAIVTKLTHPLRKTEITPIVISYPLPWQPYLPGLLVVAAGLLYAQKPGSWFEFDRATGMVAFKRHTLSPTLKYSIQDIRAIAVEEKRFTSIEEIGECQRSYLGYRISLVLASGKIEPLAKTYSAKAKSKHETAEIIRTFLQLPPVNFKQGQ